MEFMLLIQVSQTGAGTEEIFNMILFRKCILAKITSVCIFLFA